MAKNKIHVPVDSVCDVYNILSVKINVKQSITK